MCCINTDTLALFKFLEHYSLDSGLRDNEKVLSFQSCFVVIDTLRFIVEDNIVIPHSPHLLHSCGNTGDIIMVPLISLQLKRTFYVADFLSVGLSVFF